MITTERSEHLQLGASVVRPHPTLTGKPRCQGEGISATTQVYPDTRTFLRDPCGIGRLLYRTHLSEQDYRQWIRIHLPSQTRDPPQ